VAALYGDNPVGGRRGTTYLNLVQAYDPVTDTWGTMKRLTTARAGLGVGVIAGEGRLYAVGGRNASTVLATNERYTP
jgi:N-acetylneuraminic acid mutarotase